MLFVKEGESVVNESQKTFSHTRPQEGAKAVGVQLEEEELERLMDAMYALNLEEASSVCVCCPHAFKSAL